jgi:hypothetical protein
MPILSPIMVANSDITQWSWGAGPRKACWSSARSDSRPSRTRSACFPQADAVGRTLPILDESRDGEVSRDGLEQQSSVQPELRLRTLWRLHQSHTLNFRLPTLASFGRRRREPQRFWYSAGAIVPQLIEKRKLRDCQHPPTRFLAHLDHQSRFSSRERRSRNSGHFLGSPIKSRSAIVSGGSSSVAAARFSRRCSTEDVPGISRMLGAR